MKKIITLILFCIILLSINYTSKAQIRWFAVDPTLNVVVIKNFGSNQINISNYELCSLFGYRKLSFMAVVAGSLNLNGGDSVILTGFTLNSTAADLGLYLPSPNFASANDMVDFTQWGSGGNGRESVAVAKGIWTAGDFIAGNPPYNYTGNGSQDGVTFWSGTGGSITAIIAQDKTTACLNDTVVFADSTAEQVLQWTWDFGAGATPAAATTKGPHSVAYSTPGTKEVTLEVVGPAGSSNDTVSVSVDSTLVVNIMGDDSLCDGQTATLDAGTGFTTYDWSTGDTTQTTDVTGSGTYTVNVSTGGTCTGMDSHTVLFFQNPMPVLTQSSDTLMVNNIPFGATIEWWVGTIPLPDTDSVLVVTTSGDYVAIVTSAQGCSASTDSLTITIGSIQERGSNTIDIYPIPSKGKVLITSSTLMDYKTISVYNLLGKKIMVLPVTGVHQQIDLTNQAEGIYFISLENEHKSEMRKIILQ
ncbi:MAG: T9SS type A sorting domain-containing protein [Bacteroidetes bacterium]|nr:T9SS type A sorting domain-containing protein [Bacteroidota bacterium]